MDGAWLPPDPEEILAHHLSDLWAYATRQWLVLHDTRCTRLERDPVAPWWAALARLEGFGAERTTGTKFRRLAPPARNPRQLLLMAVGVLSSLAALHGQETWADVMAGLDRHIKRVVGEEAFAQEPLQPLPAHWLDVLLADGPLPTEWHDLLAGVQKR